MTGILTTHVGSLPRSQPVVDFLFTRERGESVDEAALDACMRDAVSEADKTFRAAVWRSSLELGPDRHLLPV